MSTGIYRTLAASRNTAKIIEIQTLTENLDLNFDPTEASETLFTFTPPESGNYLLEIGWELDQAFRVDEAPTTTTLITECSASIQVTLRTYRTSDNTQTGLKYIYQTDAYYPKYGVTLLDAGALDSFLGTVTTVMCIGTSSNEYFKVNIDVVKPTRTLSNYTASVNSAYTYLKAVKLV